jgi:hypothetical protein
MELNEFVNETLVQICEGVKAAQGKCRQAGARINPPMFNNTVERKTNFDYWKYTEVRFKIALRSSDVENGKSGIGVLLANFTVGSTRETVQDLSSVTSVEFSVPVALPFSPVK